MSAGWVKRWPYTKRELAKLYGDGNSGQWSLPRHFRNTVNKTRRRFDKKELWKSIHLEEYEEQCSKWNCKDSNSWGWW